MSTTSADTPASVYALLADGTTIEIRPATPEDFGRVKAMHDAMSPDNVYMRFFSLSRRVAESEARRISRPPAPDHTALLALRGDEVIGVASYEIAGQPDTAEIAFAVADHMHQRGVATLLLEHLVSLARRRGIRSFVAETLSENSRMLKVFTAAGLPVQRRLESGVVELTFPLPASEAGEAGRQLDGYLDAVARRESLADVHSLRHLLTPASVAVVGVSRRTGTVGRAILHNVVGGGYAGPVFAVNPNAGQPGFGGLDGIESGVPCVPSVTDLPEPVDLAVISVPPDAVPCVAEECGRRGVKGLVVITSGLDAAQGAGLLAICRRYSMRLVGPNCFGIAVPGIGLDATFAARHPAPGIVGLVMQSGGLGLALMDHLSRLGIGISSFASVGDKYDVSSNDMLMWWEHDGVTRLAVLYIESFGNPRKFARTARRVSRSMPVLTVLAGRSPAGEKAAISHTSGVAVPLVSRTALFEQAGILSIPSLGELLDTVALLATQPVPAGRRVALVSNTGGAGVLAADACVEAGLVVHTPSEPARQRLRKHVPPSGSVAGPVDTTAAVSAEDFRCCVELLAADDGVDAVLALVLPTAATGDLTAAIRGARVEVPLAAVVMDQMESLRLLPRDTGDAQVTGDASVGNAHDAGDTSEDAEAKGTGEAGPGEYGAVPAYGYPEAAAAALARAATYGEWRARPPGQIPDFAGLRPAEARALVATFLSGAPDGGWLPAAETARLLACFGIAVTSRGEIPGQPAGTTGTTGTTGTEVMIGVMQEAMFGPLVVFALASAATEVLADRGARLAPLTDADADELIRSLRSAPLLLGHGGAPAADLAALRETLLRVSRLADTLPEVAELELSPVIARPDGAFVTGARIRLAPSLPEDPFLRRLR